MHYTTYFLSKLDRKEARREPRKMKHGKKSHKVMTLRNHRPVVTTWPKMSG